jgi:2-polyprenyl-3-methyl-5-hydroxy-6-metoxy-1,4-benzoquinol methylase
MKSPSAVLPGPDELQAVFRSRYGPPDRLGPLPRLWTRFGYYTPDVYYEATVAKLAAPGCRWLDVGGGRDVFPDNPDLARQLADRAADLVAVDPSPNVHENPLARQKVQAFIEEYAAEKPFDLVTLRMVAEHIARPDDAAAALARLTAPGGRVVVYTINVYSPVSVAAWVTPFALHHPVKRALWGTEEKDTFPVVYKMNTRRALARLMSRHGFKEAAFTHLDDCRTFFRFRPLHYVELFGQRACRAAGLPYPENCLLGVYERA